MLGAGGAATTAGLDVPLDEWEWPADCREQREMEEHLRCQICGDFFHGPVLLPCSHTFCSTCVRRFLQSKGAQSCCPSCKHPCTPRELVANRALEHVALLFQRSKPELLKRLQSSRASSSTTSSSTSTPATDRSGGSARKHRASAETTTNVQEKLERLPLVSYSVMRDKEVRKLLDAINIRVTTKNREEIIQIHKEADSCNPKSAKELREEVVRNHHARVQQKAKADAAKKSSSTGNGGNASPAATSISMQMQAQFERLKQDIADRKAGKTHAHAPASQPSQSSQPLTGDDASSVEEEASPVGVWRHFCALDTPSKEEFFVNSQTHEIRVQRPSPVVQEQSPANRYDDLSDALRAAAVPDASASRDSATKGDDEKTVATTLLTGKSRAKRDIAAAFFSPDAVSESNFQSATPDVTVPDNEEQSQLSVNGRRTGLGKHARGDDVDQQSNKPSEAEVGDEENDDVAWASKGANLGGPAPKWECSRCTLLNEPLCKQCEACGYERVSTAAKKRQRKKMHFQSKISLS